MDLSHHSCHGRAAILQEEEREARVFRDLDAARCAARRAVAQGGVILLQHPDRRSVSQRVRAWWYLRRSAAVAPAKNDPALPNAEPDWPRHWATMKYL